MTAKAIVGRVNLWTPGDVPAGGAGFHGAKLSASGPQVITAGVSGGGFGGAAQVVLDQVDFDTDGYAGGSDNIIIPAGLGGIYVVGGTVPTSALLTLAGFLTTSVTVLVSGLDFTQLTSGDSTDPDTLYSLVRSFVIAEPFALVDGDEVLLNATYQTDVEVDLGLYYGLTHPRLWLYRLGDAPAVGS